MTPFYYPFSFGEHCDHYRAIIDAAEGLPMVVYNIPALSGVKLSLDQISTLITLPGVAQSYTINAEKAHGYGLELGADYQVLDTLKLLGSIGVRRVCWLSHHRAGFGA